MARSKIWIATLWPHGSRSATQAGSRVGRRRIELSDLAAFPGDPQYPVAVFLAEVGDRHAGGFEDPQPEQAEHRDEGEVVDVGGGAGGGEHRFELQMGQSEGG